MNRTSRSRVCATAIVALVLLACHSSAQVARPDVVWSRDGAAAGNRLGTEVAGIADLDGDGIGDVIAGAPGAGASSGLVRVLSGRDGTDLFVLNAPVGARRFGIAVDSAGDVDGDGTDDVVVGATLGTPASGSAYVYSGSTGAPIASFAGASDGDQFGRAVCGVGDVNGDGRADFAVGAPHADAAGTNAGRVVVFSGMNGAQLLVLDGGAPWDFFGSSVDGPGDVDGDGVPDILIGAPFTDMTGFNAGSAYVYSGANGALVHAFHGTQVGDWLGSEVSSAGDVDADGIPDLLVGIPGADLSGIDSGGAQVYSGVSGATLLVIGGTSSGDYLAAVSAAGDVDHDGHDDLAVGAASSDIGAHEGGRVRVVSGRTGADIRTFEGGTNDWLGAAVACPAPATGSGPTRLILGAPGHDDVTTKKGSVQLVVVAR